MGIQVDKFANKYKISSSRLEGHDYGSSCGYFITICTKNRIHYFGDLVETGHCGSPISASDSINSISPETGNCPSLQTSLIGQIATEYWNEIPAHYPMVSLDEFILMPDHLHGILFLNRIDNPASQPNAFGIQSMNLGAVIRAYKSSVKRFSNQHQIPFEWQPRFYDHIIHNEKELTRTRQYIFNNPSALLNPSDIF